MTLPIAKTLSVLDQATIEIITPPLGALIDGWNDFNQMTGGLRPKEFSIFCGPTGAGKSLWLANLTAKLISQKQKVFVAPIEIGEVDFTKMVLSVLAGHDFISGEPADEQTRAKLHWVLKNYQDLIAENLIVTTYSSRVDIDEFIELMKFVNDIHRANIMIVDNLNFMLKPARGGDQTLEMDETVHKFVQSVKVTPMHIFLVMHPRKTVDGKIVSEFDIKGSSTAVQEATNILLMNRLTKDEQDAYGLTGYDREFVFKKLRKRGKYVNQFFYMRNEDAKGRYVEVKRAATGNASGNAKTFAEKWGKPSVKRGSNKPAL
jgi:energy-coupling factor transporter ATP-binding protein EcfA2